MNRLIKENKWLITISIAGLLIRIVFFIYIKPWESNVIEKIIGTSDSSEYHKIAQDFVENGKYPDNIYLDVYRTPVFPLYASLFYFIFGIKPYMVLFSYIFLNIIAIIFLYLLCKKMFDNKIIALIVASLYSLEPNVIKLTTEFGTETLHATFLLVSVYYFIAGLKDKKNAFIIISAAIFAITALTRPVSLYFYILCLLFILFFPGEKLKRKFLYLVFFAVTYLITITPWMYRNYVTYGYFSTGAFQGNQMMYNAGVLKSYVTGIPIESSHREFINELIKICDENKITNQFEIEKQKNKLGFDYITKHLDSYSVLQLKGIVNFFVAPLFSKSHGTMNKIFASVYMFIIYSFCLLGIFKLIKNKNYFNLIFLLSLILYFCFLTGILGVARYRLPTTAFYLIFTAYGIYFLYNNIKNKIVRNKI